MAKTCILILGGARSGKSRFAQELASRMGSRVLMVATAEPLDEEMRLRIEGHRKNRPPAWRTLEAPQNIGKSVAAGLGDAEVVIVDCLTLLVSNVLTRGNPASEQNDYPIFEQRVAAEVDRLLRCIDETSASFILVSNEVGAGLVPGNPLERLYRDLLGKTNQALAGRADEVYFMMAGIPLKIKDIPRPGAQNEAR